MTDTTFTIERHFDAPRALAWRCWTDPELLARWYGPGIETIIHKLDVRPGGVWLNEMRHGGGGMFERMDYTDVDPEQRLAWHHSTTDADWNVVDNPMMPGWPRVLLATVTFETDGDGTKVRLDWTPHEASAEAEAVFQGAMAGFGRGWGAGFDIIGEILAELQAG
jgi:uncharacterized protein YndB with AHSA1/START domain